MKRLSLYLLLSTIYGCKSIFSPIGTSTSNVKPAECPEEPQVRLFEKNLREIDLSDEFIDSAVARRNKTLGYIFQGEKEQKLKYETEQNICIWIYTPEGEILNSSILPTTGKYIIQVSTTQASLPFELSLNLEDKQADKYNKISSEPEPNGRNTPSEPSNKNTSNSQTSETKRPSPTQFVTNHYQTLNQRDYSTTWKSLSPKFQKIAGSFGGYVEWWDSVEQINIGEVTLVAQNDLEAIVDAELVYTMKTGKSFEDEKNRIYLVWEESLSSWQFFKKTSPP